MRGTVDPSTATDAEGSGGNGGQIVNVGEDSMLPDKCLWSDTAEDLASTFASQA